MIPQPIPSCRRTPVLPGSFLIARLSPPCACNGHSIFTLCQIAGRNWESRGPRSATGYPRWPFAGPSLSRGSDALRKAGGWK
jgi:hypothetical protein